MTKCLDCPAEIDDALLYCEECRDAFLEKIFGAQEERADDVGPNDSGPSR